MTGRERLLQIAPLLWGERWQTAMAEELGISRRTVSRYALWKPLPAKVARELDVALLARLEAMVNALEVPERLKAGVQIAIDDIKGFLKGPADAEG